MTNAEKYLKDGKATEELIATMENELPLSYVDVAQFWGKTIQLTLTEDERVILRNLRYEKGAYEYTKIGRTDLDSEGNCDLILIDSDDESVWWGEYGHLFQFIKERRRIRDKGVIKQ